MRDKYNCCKCNREAIGYSRLKHWCLLHCPPILLDALRANAKRKKDNNPKERIK